MTLSKILFLCALVCFALAVFDVHVDVELLPLGLAFLAGGHLA